MSGFWIIAIIFGGLGAMVSMRLKQKFARYSAMPTSSGLSGAEVAQQMLASYNIYNVKIQQGRGLLTDHYNPKNRTVVLSPAVYHGRNVAAAAVAAHECGHAVQHATNYAFLRFRSSMVPLVKVSSNLWLWLIMGGMFLQASPFGGTLLNVGIALFAVATLFSLVTLPVEFDATHRAIAWLDRARITNDKEHVGAKDALKWAARTYVVAAVGSVAQLLYFIGMSNRR